MKSVSQWLLENQGNQRGLKIFEKFDTERRLEIIDIIENMKDDIRYSNDSEDEFGYNLLTDLQERIAK